MLREMEIQGRVLKGGEIAATVKPPSAEAEPSPCDRKPDRNSRLRRTAASSREFAQREPIRLLAYGLIALSFVFMVMPWIDLAVSGWFADADGNFPLARDATLMAIRDVNRLVPRILLPTLAVIVLVHVFSPRFGWLLQPHRALYVLGVYAIGPGLVVSVLKMIVERARPEDTIAFGERAPFTIPWQFADACTKNCSFPSGEGASAAALMSCVMLAPASMRRPFFWGLLPLAIVFSTLRIAFGKHFLSDVVVSWLLVAMVAVLLWRWFAIHGEKIDRTITGSGLPLVSSARRFFSRLTGAAG
ncbi:MAG: phosphatase PAP2 family protein [Mesorhizobium sp.]